MLEEPAFILGMDPGKEGLPSQIHMEMERSKQDDVDPKKLCNPWATLGANTTMGPITNMLFQEAGTAECPTPGLLC